MLFKKDLAPNKIRDEFYCLRQSNPPIYLDNACMNLKPDSVIKAITSYYQNHPSCHGRSNHEFSEKTTIAFESTRQTIQKFINTRKNETIVFTKNATESINLLAQMISFKEGDVVLTTDLEHNSNLLPWQFLVTTKKIKFKQLPITPFDEDFNLSVLEDILKNNSIKLVSLFHISNVTGIKLPIEEISKIAHKYGAKVLLDAAQSASHKVIDVQKLNIDYMAFSMHKIFGPTGVGILYAKEKFLEEAIPLFIGGQSIVDTDYNSCQLQKSPEKFETGLQNYAGIIGSKAAIDFISKYERVSIQKYISNLNIELTEGINKFKELNILGPKNPVERNGITNLILNGKKAEEISNILSNTSRIMLRSGVHCCHAWYHKYQLSPSLRISLSLYNTSEEIQILLQDLKRYFN